MPNYDKWNKTCPEITITKKNCNQNTKPNQRKSTIYQMFNRKNEGKQFMQIKIKPICKKQHIARLNVPQAKTERKKLNNNF